MNNYLSQIKAITVATTLTAIILFFNVSLAWSQSTTNIKIDSSRTVYSTFNKKTRKRNTSSFKNLRIFLIFLEAFFIMLGSRKKNK